MSGIVGSYFNTRGSGVVAKLGTDGQVFTSTGAGLSQGFEAVAAGGAFTYIDGATASDSATIDVDGIDSTYEVYLIQINGISVATDASYGRIRLKVGGSAVTSSDYRYGSTWMSSSGSYPGGTTRSDDDDEFVTTYNGTSDAAAEPKDVIVWLYNPASTALWKSICWHDTGMQHDGYLYSTMGAGLLETTSAVTGLSYYQNNGNLTTGNIRLYGLAKS